MKLGQNFPWECTPKLGQQISTSLGNILTNFHQICSKIEPPTEKSTLLANIEMDPLRLQDILRSYKNVYLQEK